MSRNVKCLLDTTAENMKFMVFWGVRSWKLVHS